MNSESKTIVLIVDDDFVDSRLVKVSIERRELPFETVQLEDGRQALSFLREHLQSDQESMNLIVLLDINMPGMNGHQFLDELRQDLELHRTVVFMLTTSEHQRDIAKAYDRNVSGYFTKQHLEGLLDTIENFANSAEFPPLAKPDV